MAALREDAIFDVARHISSGTARDAYLEQVCNGDNELRARLVDLLAAHEATDSRLDNPLLQPTAAHVGPVPLEKPGMQIGPYKLRESIGEGGMGIVYVAEQTKPLRRKVALKVIKPGMDSKAVIARFEAERNALAMMNHPNIAKVLDAGTTGNGHPFFVMELVQGIPITEYCDLHRMSIRDRLCLFMTVCQAIQHAHQKGIIHRDIKPNNVLVTELDGKPVAKVIDFGVAKALNQSLTEHSIYTSFQAVVGTPLYMSPEQASLSSVDVDTRSDVYSLGVLLYELLTGTTPFQMQELKDVAQDEVLRFIREQEPQRPSNRISTLGDRATRISQVRSTMPEQLGRQVRGDLDWIVMKALEKERARRYKTADALVTDIERHLNDEPVEARPPSTTYRLRKAASRHRAALAVAGVITITLVLATAVSIWFALREAAAERVARLKQREAEDRLKQVADASYEQAVAHAIMGNNEMALDAADSAEKAGEAPTRTDTIRGLVALNRGDYDEALRLADSAIGYTPSRLREQPETIGARAIRAAASFVGGEGYTFDEDWRFLHAMTPRSDADRLLKAYALAETNPKEAVATLDTPASFHSPAGLLVRAKAAFLHCIDQHDSPGMERVVTDFEYLQDIFHGSEAVVAWRLAGLATAIECARREGRVDDVTRHTEVGKKVARELNSTSTHAAYRRWLFYRAVGDTQQAIIALRSAKNPRWISWYLAADCLRRNADAADAAREFDEAYSHYDISNAHFRFARAHLVRDLDNGEAQTHEQLKGLIDHTSRLVVRQALCAQCLIDRPEQIKEQAGRILRTMGNDDSSTESLWGGAEIKYLAGDLTETQLLDSVKGRGFAEVTAHFAIAMLRLAEGDRSAAQEHFAAAVATNTIGCEHYEMALAYHTRLADPDWPRWLVTDRRRGDVQD